MDDLEDEGADVSTAAQTQPEDHREVLLIDLSSLFWTAWHSSGNDAVSDARNRTLTAVQRCIGEAPDRLVAICCDSGRSFRKDLAPAYKANRPERDHASLGELDRTKDKLRADGFLLWEVDGFEADDVIATACELAIKHQHPVMIASADKDLLQLVSDWVPVKALRTHNWTTVGEKETVEKFGVPVARLGDWLALVGDSSDNIKGAPGVGPKTATSLLTTFESLDAIWQRLKEAPETVATPSVRKSLQGNWDAVMLARKLVTLRTDAPIDFDELFAPREAAQPEKEPSDMDEPDPNFTDKGAAMPEKAANGNGNGHEKAPTDLAVVPAQPVAVVPYERGLEPTSIGVAFKLGQALYESRLYARFPNAQAITAVIIRGREMGLGALTSLDVFHVVEGKPYPYAYLIIARAKADPDCEYFQLVESSDTSATWETKNRRNPTLTRRSYTIDQAKHAGLCEKEKSNWNTRPEDMLIKTAGAKLARAEYPSAALGLISVEEAGLE